MTRVGPVVPVATAVPETEVPVATAVPDVAIDVPVAPAVTVEPGVKVPVTTTVVEAVPVADGLTDGLGDGVWAKAAALKASAAAPNVVAAVSHFLLTVSLLFIV